MTSDTGSAIQVIFPYVTSPKTYQILLLDSLNGAEVCRDSISIPVKAAPDVSISLAPGGTPGIQMSGNTISLCGNAAPITIRIRNESSTAAINTGYTISWGDGATNTYLPPEWTSSIPVSHTYAALGAYNIVITATHSNGCTRSRSFPFFSGTNPPLSFSSPGGTVGLCAPDTLAFELGGYQGASDATVYQVFVNGKLYKSYNQLNIQSIIPIIFTESSCGQGSGPSANIFTVTIRGGVPGCPQTEIDVKPVTVSSSPVAIMEVLPPPNECPGEVWKFINRSWGAAVITPGPNNTYTCDSTNVVEWEIFGGTQGADWEYVSGGPFDPMMEIRFKKTGFFTVRMTAYNLNSSCPSGKDVIERTIFVAEEPTADANAQAVSGNGSCAPLTLKMKNFSTFATGYFWTVTPLGNTPPNGFMFDTIGGHLLAEPGITFKAPGTYQISLKSINPCSEATWDTTIVVTALPQLALEPLSACQGQAVNMPPSQISLTDNGAPVTQWLWTFPAGSAPPSSTAPLPLGVVFPNSGAFSIIVTATNACGTGTDTAALDITAQPMLAVTPVFHGGPDCLPDSIVFQQLSQPGVSYWRTISGPAGGFQYLSGDSATAAATLQFLEPGTYQIHLEAYNHCDTVFWDWEHSFFKKNILELPTLGPFCDTITLYFSPSMPGLTVTTGNDPNASFQWQFSGGNPASSNLQFPGPVFFENTSGATQTITITVTASNLCTATPVADSLIFELQVPAQISIDTLAAPICDNHNPLPLTATPGPGTWAGPGVSGNQFDPADSAVPANMPFWLYYSYGAGVCTALDSIPVLVSPAPVANAGLDQTRCIETGPLALANVPNGSWTISAPGVLINNGTTVDFQASGSGLFTLTLTAGDTLTGCQNSDTFILEIKNNTDPNPPDTAYCNVPGLVNLPLYNVPGLLYSSPNVVQPGNRFNPDGLIPGNFTVLYTMTNNDGCDFSGNIQIAISAPLTPGAVQAGPDQTLCAYDSPLTLQGTPAPGFWKSIPATAALNLIDPNAPFFDPALADDGLYRLVYSVGGGNCADHQTDTLSLRVVRLLPVAGPDETACVNDPVIALSAAGPPLPSGVIRIWHGNGILDSLAGTFAPAVAGLQSHTITMELQDTLSGCVFSDQKLVTVNGLAGSLFDVAGLKCAGVVLNLNNQTPGAATQAWFLDGAPNAFSTAYNPQQTFTSGNHTLMLVSTTPAGCLDTISQNFYIEQAPVADILANSPVSGCGPLTVGLDVQTSFADTVWLILDSAGVQQTLPVQPSLVFANGPDLVRYKLILAAQNECTTLYDTLVVTVKSDPVARFSVSYTQPCEGDTVFAKVNSSGGPTANYFYTSEDPTHISADTLVKTLFQFYTGTQPKTVQIYLVSINECGSDTTLQAITVLPTDVSALFNIAIDTSTLCPGDKVRVINGSTPGVPVRWETSWGDKYLGDTVFIALPQNAGAYWIRVIIDHCGRDTFTMPIWLPPSPVLALDVSPPDCLGEPTQFGVTTSAAGFTLYYGDGDSTQQSVSNHTFELPGDYHPAVVATSMDGCTVTVQATARVFPLPEFSVLLQDSCTVAYGTNLTVLTDPFNTASLLRDGILKPGKFHPGLEGGLYVLTVKTLAGCLHDTIVEVPVPDELTLSVDTNLIFIQLGDSALVAAQVNQLNVAFQWSPGQYVSDSAAAITHAKPIEDTRFTVVATNGRGCSLQASVLVNVREKVDIYFPNVFAPEKEGGNETWYISAGPGVKEIRRLRIFNRWGNLVFERKRFLPNDQVLGWNGNHPNGEPANPGVFVYLAELLIANGKVELFSGDVTVVR